MTLPTIDVWPNPELNITVTLASGYVITASGAEALATDEILRLIRKSNLLTFDPSGVNPNPSPIPPTPGGGGGASVATIAGLGLLPGVTSGLTCYCQGFRTLGDGGEGNFYWEQGSSTPADGGTVIAAGGGRWKRVNDTPRYRNAKWFGAYGDGIHDDTAAIQATINSVGAFGFGADIFIPAGTYKITSTLRLEFGSTGPWSNVTLRGDTAGVSGFPATELVWYGPPVHPTFSTPASAFEPYTNGSVFFQVNGYSDVVEQLTFKVATGHACGCIINIGYDQGPVAASINGVKIKNCALFGGSYTTGSANYAIVWDYWRNAGDENTEDCAVIDCAIGGVKIGAVWFRLTTQPFGTQFQRCYFANSQMIDPLTPGYVGNEPYGSAFINDTLNLSLTVQDCDIQRFAAVFFINTHPQNINCVNCHSEATKKLWFSNSGGWNDLCSVSFDGGRHSPDGIIVQSYGPNTTWAPTDYQYLWFRGDHPASIRNVTFTADYAPFPMQIRSSGNDIVSSGNRYPNTYPFLRLNPFFVEHMGGIWSTGDTGSNGSNAAESIPRMLGCVNGPGSVTISGASTFADVVFAHNEPINDAFGSPIAQNYKISLSVQGIVGTPTVTTPYLSNIAQSGFRVNLPTAPGLGNSVTVAYEPYR